MVIEIGCYCLFGSYSLITCPSHSSFSCSECTKKSNVEEKRAAAIRGFYKKWSPENVDKADALAKKADSNGKMAALFRKLVTKYPKSIKVEVSRIRLFKLYISSIILLSSKLITCAFSCLLAAPSILNSRED